MSEERESSRLARLKTFIFAKYRRIVPFLLILGLLLYELSNPNQQYVTWQSVALIGILLVLVFLEDIDTLDVPGLGSIGFQKEKDMIATAQWLSYITKQGSSTTAGEEDSSDEEIWAEDDFEDKPVENEEKSVSSGGAHFYSGKPVHEISENIYDLAQNDPRLALVKLRSEIEGTARKLAEKRHSGPILSDKNLMNVLHDENLIPDEIVNTYSDVLQAYNAAIHYENVNFGEVLDAIEVGLDLLGYLKSVGHDGELVSKKMYWTGLDLLVKFQSFSPKTTFNLREANDEVGALIMQFRTDENGEFILQTDKIGPGQYIICQGNDPVALKKQGEAEFQADVDDATFELVNQTLDAQFERREAVNAGNSARTRLNVASNRASFVVWIWTDTLAKNELESIFVNNTNYLGSFSNVETDYVAFNCESSQDIIADFTGIEPGVYLFDLVVPDTHIRDTAEITVNGSN